MERLFKDVITISVSILVFAFDCLVRRFGRLPLHSRASGVVLLYHAVPEKCFAGFSRQLDALQRIGPVVGWADVLRPPDGRWAIAITFDDALESIGSLVVDELVRRQMRATVFVPTGSLGAIPEWTGGDIYHESVLTAEQLSAMPEEWIELGGHSRNHFVLTELDGPALKAELTGCFDDLVRINGVAPAAFAVPFGFWDQRVVDMAISAGFQRVFSVEPSPVFNPDALVVPRVTVQPTDSLLVFRLKALGSYRWIGHWMAFKRRIGMLSPPMTHRL